MGFPGGALRAELPALLDAQPHSAQAAVVKTINRMSAFQCASIALRIRAGDKDAFILSVAK